MIEIITLVLNFKNYSLAPTYVRPKAVVSLEFGMVDLDAFYPLPKELSVNERLRIVNELMKTKTNEIDPKAWFAIRSIFTTIERDHQLKAEEWGVINNTMNIILTEAHELNTGERRNASRRYQQR